MSLIEKFSIAFATDLEKWKFWKEEVGSSSKLIIAGPSRIVGLLDLTLIEEDLEWATYSIESIPTNKMKGNFVFDGRMYSMDFLKKIVQFLPESVEIARLNEAILFKLTETVALGLAEKITNDEFYYDDDGVMFVESDWEELSDNWKTVTTAKEFIKWENNMAKRKHKSKSNVWYEEVYKFEKFFIEEDEMGDFMLI